MNTENHDKSKAISNLSIGLSVVGEDVNNI